jgi:hypothetical protein
MTEDVLFVFMDGSVAHGVIREQVNVFSFGPSVIYMQPLENQRTILFLQAMLGQFRYTNKAVLYEETVLRGRTYGGSLGVGIEHRIKCGLGVGLQAGTSIARLWTVTASTDLLGRNLIANYSAVDLSRIDAGIGISYTY